MIYILATIWLAISAFLLIYLGHTPKGKGWLRILWHNRKVRRGSIIAIVTISAIVAAYAIIPSSSGEKIESRPIFEGYAQSLIFKLQEQGAIVLDSTCDLDAPQPEITYILPVVIGVYNEIVKKPTTPRLARIDDIAVIYFDGYKQFRNRSINIVKGLQKRLGPRYVVQIINGDSSHELKIAYKGKLWDNEQLCGLPVMEASIREGIDPALLMSIIRHISGFDFNYEGNNRERGLMALESGYGLEQILIGARMLRDALDSTQSIEDAVATFYPVHDLQGMNTEWRKSPLKNSWVREVIAGIPFYRNNGLK